MSALARRTDPDTSHQAAIQFVAVGKHAKQMAEVLKVFQSDLDNRCQIDFRESHDHDDYIIAGGEYFGRVAQKLSAHIREAA